MGSSAPWCSQNYQRTKNQHVYGLKWAVVDSFIKERLRAETLGLLRDTNPRSLLFFLVDLHCPALLHKLKENCCFHLALGLSYLRRDSLAFQLFNLFIFLRKYLLNFTNFSFRHFTGATYWKTPSIVFISLYHCWIFKLSLQSKANFELISATCAPFVANLKFVSLGFLLVKRFLAFVLFRWEDPHPNYTLFGTVSPSNFYG